jgi:hypothetical protein
MPITIPAGREVKITKDGANILADYATARLELEEDLVLNLSSSFKPFLKDTSSSALNSIIAGAVNQAFGKTFSTNFKQMSFLVWESTDPLGISLTVTLRRLTNAQKEVWEPSKLLMKIPLPEEQIGEGGKSKGIGLIPPGPTIFDLLEASKMGGTIATFGSNYGIRIGKVYLDSIIFKTITPQYSPEVDENGYYIKASVRIDCSTIFVATQNLIDSFK